ncbi:MAG TPA: transposase [Terracidiphilus sp.]
MRTGAERRANLRSHAAGTLGSADHAGAMSLRGIDAAMTIESATDGGVFKGYVKQVLCPKLRPGDVVILDNLSAHKAPGTYELIEACGAQLLYLPPYSPDLEPH